MYGSVGKQVKRTVGKQSKKGSPAEFLDRTFPDPWCGQDRIGQNSGELEISHAQNIQQLLTYWPQTYDIILIKYRKSRCIFLWFYIYVNGTGTWRTLTNTSLGLRYSYELLRNPMDFIQEYLWTSIGLPMESGGIPMNSSVYTTFLSPKKQQSPMESYGLPPESTGVLRSPTESGRTTWGSVMCSRCVIPPGIDLLRSLLGN